MVAMNEALFRHDDPRARREIAISRNANLLAGFNEAPPRIAKAVPCIAEAIAGRDNADAC